VADGPRDRRVVERRSAAAAVRSLIHSPNHHPTGTPTPTKDTMTNPRPSRRRVLAAGTLLSTGALLLGLMLAGPADADIIPEAPVPATAAATATATTTDGAPWKEHAKPAPSKRHRSRWKKLVPTFSFAGY
jgi:hypothetical protein